MKILAITTEGKEFMYKKNSVHGVPQKKAQEICDRLNKVRYRIRDNEKWFVYEVDKYDDAFYYAQDQKFYNTARGLKARDLYM